MRNPEYPRQWWARNREHAEEKAAQWRARDGNLRRAQLKYRHGITPEQYETMLESQAGCCAVCGAKPNGRRLHVDHNHTTGAVRGLLCHNCNVALGLLAEDSGRLRALATYTETKR